MGKFTQQVQGTGNNPEVFRLCFQKCAYYIELAHYLLVRDSPVELGQEGYRRRQNSERKKGSDSVIRISWSALSLLTSPIFLKSSKYTESHKTHSLLCLRKSRDVRDIGSSRWGVSVRLRQRYRTKRMEIHIWRGFIMGIAQRILEAEKSHDLQFAGWGLEGLVVHITEMHRLHLDRRTGDGRVSGRENDSFFSPHFLSPLEGYQYQVGSMGGTVDLSHGRSS